MMYPNGYQGKVKSCTNSCWCRLFLYEEGFYFLGGFSLFLFISFFNQNPDVIAIGVDRAKICAFFYVLLGFSHVVSSILRGLGRPVMPMVVMLVCWCAVRVVVLMTIGQSVHSLYLTHWLYPITWGLSSIVYIFDLRKYKLFMPRA